MDRDARGGGPLSRLGERWDNDDVRVRPGRSSRPRTKTRPGHADAAPGLVITVDRGRYGCLVGTGPAEHLVVAMRARELGRRGVVVGDRVDLVGNISGDPDALARVVRVAPRTSVLRRSADDQVDPDAPTVEGGPGQRPPAGEKVLVANADQLLIVTAVADPEPRPGFIDRCLVAAYTGRLHPILVLTKTDLADPGPLEQLYADLDLTVVVTRRAAAGEAADPADLADLADRADLRGSRIEGLDTLAGLCHNLMSVLIGHSGVGKSTLVNRLVPDAARATGAVTGVGKGRHTSTSAVALALPGGGWVVDTPGVRSLGLAHVSADDLLETFDDLLPATVDCPPGCDHSGPDGGPDSTGTGCALDGFVAAGGASPARLASFRRLLASRTGGAGD